jgi:nucleotide-binding universal stress UspA family protein
MTGTRRADHPVVVGYHGTDSTRRALAYAADTARLLQRPMLVVYVLPAIRVAPVAGQVIRPTGDRHETVRVLGVYRSWWHGAARSSPGRLARHAACPVIVVP